MIITSILTAMSIMLTVILWKDIKFLCKHMWNE